jgi:hypothetical protein
VNSNSETGVESSHKNIPWYKSYLFWLGVSTIIGIILAIYVLNYNNNLVYDSTNLISKEDEIRFLLKMNNDIKISKCIIKPNYIDEILLAINKAENHQNYKNLLTLLKWKENIAKLQENYTNEEVMKDILNSIQDST